MKKQHLILMFCVLSVLCLAMTGAAQTSKGFNGNWEWRGAMNKKKEQTAVWVDIKQKGNRATGSIWFNQLVDEEPDGSDASFVPFAGTISGNTLMIEFNPEDIHSIDEENVRYKKPREKPSIAVLRLKNGKLEWTQTQGVFEVGLTIPKQMTLRRSH